MSAPAPVSSTAWALEPTSLAQLQPGLWGAAAGDSSEWVPDRATFGMTRAQHALALEQPVTLVQAEKFTPPVPPVSTLQTSFSLPILEWSGYVRMFASGVDGTLPVGDVIKERYEIESHLGEATTSRVVRCWDLMRPLNPSKNGPAFEDVCIKVLSNSKTSLDTGLHEIRILQQLQQSLEATGRQLGDVGIVELKDYFYLAPHLFVVYQRLADDLRKYQTYLRAEKREPYFTLQRLQKITAQLLKGLAYMHSVGVVHCDLKPENILFFSYSRCEVRLADLGHASFVSEFPHYRAIGSRSYCAPECTIHAHSDARLDIWSLGATLAELLTGYVLFPHGNSEVEVMARIVDMCGPLPASVVHQARDASHFFTAHGALYSVDEPNQGPCWLWPKHEVAADNLEARRQRLREWLRLYPPEAFDPNAESDVEALTQLVDLIARCLHTDYQKRPSAQELLAHPFIQTQT